MPVTAAELQIKLSTVGAAQASGELRNFGAQVDSVGTKAGRANTQLRDAKGRFVAVGDAADGAGRKMGKAGKQTGLLNNIIGDTSAKGLLGAAGVASLGFAAVEMGQQAVGAAIDWESAFAGVRKTVDATDAELDVLEQGIRDMATEMPIAATELAGIAEAAGALGIAKQDVLAFTETAALIGTTTDVSSDQASTALGQLSNVLGLTTEDYERFGSTLVDLGNKGASTESAILGIASRSGAASELIGFATDETLAWASAIANLGIETEAGGSSLQKFFLESQKHIAAAGAELEVMAETAGMTGEAFQQAFEQDSSAALQSFIVGLGELDQSAQLAVLSALGFNDVRITRALLGLAGNTDNLTNSLNVSEEAWRANNAMQIEAEKRFETTASKIQVAKNRLNEYNLELSEVYLPLMADAVTATGPFIEVLSASAGEFSQANTNMRLMTDGLENYIALTGFAGESTVSWEESLANAVTNITPFVSALKTGNDVLGLFGVGAEETKDDTDEFTESLKENEDQIRAWVRAIEDALPGVQSEDEATRKFNRTLAENQSRFRAAEGATLDAKEAADLYAVATMDMTREGHRGIQMADQLGVSVNDLDRAMQDLNTEAVDPLTAAVDGLAGVYQDTIGVMDAFTSQAKEFEGTHDALTAAYEAIQAKQEAGIELTDKEIFFLEEHEDALRRLEGGQQDATIEAGYAALAAVELMEAQDALNEAIKNGETNLEPYKQRVEDAQEALGIMGDETGNTQTAQEDLKDVIQNDLIAALDDMTRKIEYVAKPWLIEIDAATDAAEEEIARLKEMIESGAMLPVAISTEDTIQGYAMGGMVPETGLALVGEQGPELTILPQGAQVIPAPETSRILPFLGGFATGTIATPSFHIPPAAAGMDGADIRLLAREMVNELRAGAVTTSGGGHTTQLILDGRVMAEWFTSQQSNQYQRTF